MSHIRANMSRINTSKLLRACEAGRHWPEACFILCETEDFDSAVKLQIEHAPAAFDPTRFCEIVTRVRNAELHYAALAFFVDEEPALLLKLLTVLTVKLDHARVVHQFRKMPDAMPLILPYLKSVQKDNIGAVNEAVNTLLVEEEDVDGLRASIESHDNFDQVRGGRMHKPDRTQSLTLSSPFPLRRLALHSVLRSTSSSSCAVLRLSCTRRTSGGARPSRSPSRMHSSRTPSPRRQRARSR